MEPYLVILERFVYEKPMQDFLLTVVSRLLGLYQKLFENSQSKFESDDQTEEKITLPAKGGRKVVPLRRKAAQASQETNLTMPTEA